MEVTNLGAIYRDSYRAAFKADVVAGTAKRVIAPYVVFGGFIVPVLYMSIPHTNRPWLYNARWLVLAYIAYFNIKMMSETSSTNMALSYGCGLWGFWGIMSNFTLLVWTRPQFEAERVMKRKKAGLTSKSNGVVKTGDAHATGSSADVGQNGATSELKHRGMENGKINNGKLAPGADAQYEYYWQAYPKDGTFVERLGWVLDLYTNFRGTGWNWGVRSVPNPPRPEKPLSGELVKMDSMPLRTSSGYRTYRSTEEFLRVKLTACVFAYFTLDFLKVAFMMDNYFIQGPNAPLSNPSLSALNPWLLDAGRNIGVLMGVCAALIGIFSAHDIAQYYLVSKAFPMRAEVWQHSSVFGSFIEVLDRGLAGFWGSWWHQTFRFAFSGPGTWLVKQGYLEPRKQSTQLVVMFIAFFQSGLLHGCGSWTAIPKTNTWLPAVFFLLSGVGIVIQQALCIALKPQISMLPRFLRRAGNLAFVTLWLHFTVWPLANDFALTGLWLFEPVPISLIRLLGFGQPGESWWRMDMESYPHWHTGKHWWESGIGG